MTAKTLLLLSMVILFSCQSKKTNTKGKEIITKDTTIELTDAQLANADLSLGKIESQTISLRIKVNGKIEVPPQNMISISVPLGGYVKSTKLLPGMQIHKGEVLAVMEDQQYIQLQEDYLISKAQLTSIEEEFIRQKVLNASKATSDKVFQNAQTAYLSQKIKLKSLSEKLTMIGINPKQLNENSISSTLKIVSPINGFVSQVKMNIGKYVAPTDVLFELIDISDIHLSLTLFEKDLKNLSIGQKLYAYNNFDPSTKYLCEIILIGNDVTPERTIQVHCHFKSYNKHLIPGMYMNADIEVGNKTAYAIPSDAIVLDDGRNYVFTQNNKHVFEMHKVTIQNTQDDLTQITFEDNANLKDKTFVTQNAYTLLMKMKNKD